MSSSLKASKVKTTEIFNINRIGFLVTYLKNLSMNDEEERFYIDKYDIEVLLEYCKRVLEDPKKAHELLPDKDILYPDKALYGDIYFNDVKLVIKKIEAILPLFDTLEPNEDILIELL